MEHHKWPQKQASYKTHQLNSETWTCSLNEERGRVFFEKPYCDIAFQALQRKRKQTRETLRRYRKRYWPYWLLKQNRPVLVARWHSWFRRDGWRICCDLTGAKEAMCKIATLLLFVGGWSLRSKLVSLDAKSWLIVLLAHVEVSVWRFGEALHPSSSQGTAPGLWCERLLWIPGNGLPPKFRRSKIWEAQTAEGKPKGNRRETEGKPKGNGNWGLVSPGWIPQIIGRGKRISCLRVQWHLLHWVSAVLDQWLRAACVFEPTDFGLHPEPNLDFNAYGLFGFPRRLLDRPGLVQGQQG